MAMVSACVAAGVAAAPTEAMTGSDKLGAILPIVGAMLFLLVSPLLSKRVVVVVQGRMDGDARSASVHEVDPVVPPHQSEGNIFDYLEYAADAVQVVPATLLPVIGGLFAVASGNLSSVAAVSVLSLSIVVAVTLDAWVLIQAPQVYVSKKVRGYSVVSLVAMASNVVSIAIVATLG